MIKNQLFLYLTSKNIERIFNRFSNEDQYTNQFSDVKICKTERKEYSQRPINYCRIDEDERLFNENNIKFVSKYYTCNDLESVNPLETPQIEEKVMQGKIFS